MVGRNLVCSESAQDRGSKVRSIKRMPTSALLVVVLIVLALALFGCSSSTTTTTGGIGTTTSGGTPTTAVVANTSIVIALAGEPTSMDALTKEDGNMRAVTEQIYEPLVTLDAKTLAPVPMLATEWSQPDATTWQFKLRQGVTFHNGEPFTVDDAVASINKEVDPATKSEIAGLFTGVKSASKVDDTTLNITTNGPQPTLLVALSYLPMENAKWLADTPPEQIALTTNGTGPYMMDGEWKKGVSVAIKQFDGYWGDKPQVTNVSYKFLEENQTRLASLLTGESDYMMNLLPEYVPQVEEKGLKVNAGPSNEFPLIRLTSFKGPMQKTDMRLAANYAVDKQGIVDSLYGGYATVPAGQAMNPTYGGFNPDITAYPYDPAKAKELLKSAGYNNEVIQLYGETGRWLKDSEVVTAVADQLRAVGMNIELKIVGWEDYLDILLHRDKAPDMIFVSSGNDLFDASRVLNSWIATTGPLSAYGTTELDKQVTAADQAPTLEERQTQQRDLIKISHDDPYAVVIANSQNINGLSARLNYTQREDTRILVYQMTLSQ
jgi:peptide/nickel transport system substrate-binding protein